MSTDSGSSQLEIVFDGPALTQGRMNVRDLAPAMLGVGALFESANRVFNGRRAQVNVNVQATAPGSLHILYEVVQSIGPDNATFIIDGELLSTASEIKEWIFGGSIGGGLLAVIKWVRSRKPKIERVNDGLFRLTVDGETHDIPMELLRLYEDTAVRRALSDVIRPVKEDGIERLEVRDGTRSIQTVTKSDVDAFDAPESQELLLDEVRRHVFSIISLAFKEDNKWRLTDGHSTFSVSMKDENFQYRVDNNEIAFAKGDVLICDMRTIQWQARDGVRSDYEIIRVVSHRPARQLGLFDTTEASDTSGHDQ